MNSHPPVTQVSVLVVAGTPDAQATFEALVQAGFDCRHLDPDVPLPDEWTALGHVLLIPEEALTPELHRQIANPLRLQPAWSDLPVILLASASARHAPLSTLASLGNVSMLQRPLDPDALVSAVASALRARQRQFQVRDLLWQQREQAARKDEFLAMLAHELRNPLAPIRYAAHILQHPGLPESRQIQIAGLIDRQTRHIGRIIDQLLEVSRLTRGIIKLDRSRIDLAVLAREALAAHAIAAQAREITLSQEAPRPAWVEGDATRLRQVLDNLIDNAIKFSPPGRTVQVGIEAEADRVRLTVTDQGEGFDARLQGSLFEPLIQADQTLDRVRGGLGLGLALVKELVNLHGGRVSAFSEGPGRGSVFTVELPANQENLPALQDQIELIEPEAPREIVIAEDNFDTAEALQLILEAHGYSVRVVHDGAAALALLQTMRPHALICDIGLPGLSGYDVARSVSQADRAHRPGLMIAVTGYGAASDRSQALAAGFDIHLAKPIEMDDLLATLEA